MKKVTGKVRYNEKKHAYFFSPNDNPEKEYLIMSWGTVKHTVHMVNIVANIQDIPFLSAFLVENKDKQTESDSEFSQEQERANSDANYYAYQVAKACSGIF